MLTPAERSHQERGQRQQKLTDWACQLRLRVRRWVPERALVLLLASRLAVMTWLWRRSRLGQLICHIIHWRLDAALSEPAPSP